jgi:hypothetical protein
MRTLTRPLPLVFAGLAVVSAIVGAPALIALGIVGWVASLAYHTIREQSARNRQEAAFDSLPPSARLRMKKLHSTYDQLKQMIELHSDRTAVRVVGQEALREAENVLGHALRLAQARAELERTLRARSQATLELQRLQDAETQASEGPARNAIQDAIVAKSAEIKRYDTITEGIERIDAQLVKAESTLSELKSQVALAGANAARTGEDSSGLDQVVSELQALGSSLQEAENFLEDVKA